MRVADQRRIQDNRWQVTITTRYGRILSVRPYWQYIFYALFTVLVIGSG